MTANNFVQQVEALQNQYQRKLPPVMDWNPPLSGDMDMRIASDGRWYHEGNEIKRQSLANLFASILKREGDDYFLVTPVEKWRIRVDDAPFVAVKVEQVDPTDKKPGHFVFTTNTEDQIMADNNHPLWVEHDPESGEPRPYLMVRNGLPALIHRNVYYQLVELALKNTSDDKNIGIESCGQFFPLN